MWLVLALFAFLGIYGVGNAPLSDAQGALFFLVFAALFLVAILVPLFALIAQRTVRCSECGERFFDWIFITFPVQGGCRTSAGRL